MKIFVFSCFIALFAFYFQSQLCDIFWNFGVYFPFLNFTTYFDLVTVIISPRLTATAPSGYRLFTKNELKQYNGIEKEQLYIAALGNVFDVSNATQYYGVGRTYHDFTGRDASRVLASGEFTPEEFERDDVHDQSLDSLTRLVHFVNLFKDKYKHIGKLIGRYYDEKGEPTAYNNELTVIFRKLEQQKKTSLEDNGKFAACNSEWSPVTGVKLWCSKKSGGVERDWVGVPRKLYPPGAQNYRCACINVSWMVDSEYETWGGRIEAYEGCDPESIVCHIPEKSTQEAR